MNLFEALEGEADWKRVKVDVGIVGERTSEEYMIPPLLKDSEIMTVTLPRPAGITFQKDTVGFVRVVEINRNTGAGQRQALERLGVGKYGAAGARVGDILRAVTTTTFDVPVTASLTGELSGVRRRVVLYGVDNQPWSKVSVALRKGSVSDGDITLVLERPGDGSLAKDFDVDLNEQRAKDGKRDDDFNPNDPDNLGNEPVSSPSSMYDEVSDEKGREGFNWILVATGLSFLVLVLTGFY